MWKTHNRKNTEKWEKMWDVGIYLYTVPGMYISNGGGKTVESGKQEKEIMWKVRKNRKWEKCGHRRTRKSDKRVYYKRGTWKSEKIGKNNTIAKWKIRNVGK